MEIKYIAREILSVLIGLNVFYLFVIGFMFLSDYVSLTIIRKKSAGSIIEKTNQKLYYKMLRYYILSLVCSLFLASVYFEFRGIICHTGNIFTSFIYSIFALAAYPDSYCENSILLPLVVVIIYIIINTIFSFTVVFRKLKFNKVKLILFSIVSSLLSAPYIAFVSGTNIYKMIYV